MPNVLERSEPSPENRYLREHVLRMLRSYRRWTGTDLYGVNLDSPTLARDLFDAPFALVSHGTQPDPIFNYANRKALELWEMSWDEFITLPSRSSAEPVAQAERQRLLDEVTRQGHITDYSGVRISKEGRRFRIQHAFVWNLVDDENRYCGQAAAFQEWEYL